MPVVTTITFKIITVSEGPVRQGFDQGDHPRGPGGFDQGDHPRGPPPPPPRDGRQFYGGPFTNANRDMRPPGGPYHDVPRDLRQGGQNGGQHEAPRDLRPNDRPNDRPDGPQDVGGGYTYYITE